MALKFRKLRLPLVALFVLACLPCCRLQAQVTGATVNGTVSDPQGNVVVGAKVRQGSQNNTDYTDKKIKPQITRRSRLWRFAQDRKILVRSAMTLLFLCEICGLTFLSV